MPKNTFHDDDVTDDVTGWLKVGPLYSFINEIKIVTITEKRTKISFNFLCKGTMRLWLHLFRSVFQLERRSKAQNIGNIHGYVAGIFSFRFTSGKKVICDLKMAAILNILKYITEIQFNLRYEMTVQYYAKNVFFNVMASSRQRVILNLPSIFIVMRG